MEFGEVILRFRQWMFLNSWRLLGCEMCQERNNTSIFTEPAAPKELFVRLPIH